MNKQCNALIKCATQFTEKGHRKLQKGQEGLWFDHYPKKGHFGTALKTNSHTVLGKLPPKLLQNDHKL